MYTGDWDKVLITALLCICCCKDALRGSVQFVWSIGFFAVTMLNALISQDYVSLFAGLAFFFYLLFMHQKDGPDGEPIIGGADVFVLPASLVMYDLTVSILGTCIGLLMVLIAGCMKKQFRVRLLSMIPLGMLMVVMLDYRVIEFLV